MRESSGGAVKGKKRGAGARLSGEQEEWARGRSGSEDPDGVALEGGVRGDQGDALLDGFADQEAVKGIAVYGWQFSECENGLVTQWERGKAGLPRQGRNLFGREIELQFAETNLDLDFQERDLTKQNNGLRFPELSKEVLLYTRGFAQPP